MHSSIKKENICFLSLISSIEVGGYFTSSVLIILRFVIYSKKKKIMFYLGIFLCPYGNVFISSLRMYHISSKQDADVLLHL